MKPQCRRPDSSERLWAVTTFIVILLMEEIRGTPVEVGSLSHYLIVLYIPGGAGFLPSTAAFCAADGEHHFLIFLMIAPSLRAA